MYLQDHISSIALFNYYNFYYYYSQQTQIKTFNTQFIQVEVKSVKSYTKFALDICVDVKHSKTFRLLRNQVLIAELVFFDWGCELLNIKYLDDVYELEWGSRCYASRLV